MHRTVCRPCVADPGCAPDQALEASAPSLLKPGTRHAAQLADRATLARAIRPGGWEEQAELKAASEVRLAL